MLTGLRLTISWLLIILLLSMLLLSLAISGCTPQQQAMIAAMDGNGRAGSGQLTGRAAQLTFAGKVANIDGGRWLNGYLVIVFLNSREVGRGVSAIGKFEPSGEGVVDGMFKVAVPNTYELSLHHHLQTADGQLFVMRSDPDATGGVPSLHRWLGEVQPGSVIRIKVPEKRIEYAVKVMDVPTANLQEALLYGGTFLDAHGEVKAELP